MNETQLTTEESSFDTFLRDWDIAYETAISEIPLFDPTLTASFSSEKKQYFVRAFYHIRGHFHDFLWYMGNHAPDVETKQIILGNIQEEFGGRYGSHETLYYDFAKSMGVDIKKEATEQETNEQYIIQFNKGHLNWLYSHSWEGCLAAFSAYEHLDNVDYKSLSLLAASLGTPREGLIFFKVHEKVEHFQPLKKALLKAWSDAQDDVKAGFDFIASHQLVMWRKLSDKLFN